MFLWWLSVIGYSIIAVYLWRDITAMKKRCRVEYRGCFGRRTVYLRDKKTGRFIGCSNNPFTLLTQGA